MGTAARLAGMLVFALFVSVIALRPLVSNPAIAGALRDGLVGWQTLAVAPLVLVALLVVVLRVRLFTDDDTQPHEERYSVATAEREDSFWEERTQDRNAGRLASSDDEHLASNTGDYLDNSDENHLSSNPGNSLVGDASEYDDRAEPMAGSEGETEPTQDRPNILSGQGGTRERDFDIEKEPPDAMLRDHLEHLQAELADDETVARDLERLEEVAQEVEGDRTIPARCPQEHCHAVWTGRTVLGIGAERYEVLEDGKRVQCLECEEVVALE